MQNNQVSGCLWLPMNISTGRQTDKQKIGKNKQTTRE